MPRECRVPSQVSFKFKVPGFRTWNLKHTSPVDLLALIGDTIWTLHEEEKTLPAVERSNISIRVILVPPPCWTFVERLSQLFPEQLRTIALLYKSLPAGQGVNRLA
jgi:hypothetical protein